MATVNNNSNINNSFSDVGRNVVPCKVKRIILDGSTPEAANSGDGGLLTTEEMDQLMDVAEEIAKTVEKPKQIESPEEDGNSN